MNAPARKVPLHRRLRVYLQPGPALVLIFVFEAIFAKGRFRGITFPTMAHLGITAGLIGVLLVAGAMGGRRPKVEWNRPGALNLTRFCVAALMLWGLVGSLVQATPVANLLFWGMWAGNLAVIWWSVPRLLRNLSEDERTRLFTAVFMVIVIGCIVMHPINGTIEGRVVGMFANATHSGRLLGFSLVFFVCVYAGERRLRFAALGMVALSAGMLLITRTRGGIGAAAIGCMAAGATALVAKQKWPRRNLMMAAIPAAFILTLAVFIVLSRPKYQEKLADFFRVSGGVERVYEARSKFWSRGASEFWDNGFFGEGFLSKFGSATAHYQVFGVRIPKYDWTTEDDPHNMYFLTAQQLGLPGLAIFIGILLALAFSHRRLDVRSRCLMAGFLATGIVFGSAEGNWLTSFGHPTDRLCFVMFAAFLSLANDRNAEAETPARQASPVAPPSSAWRTLRARAPGV